jgi:hypothetical protein
MQALEILLRTHLLDLAVALDVEDINLLKLVFLFLFELAFLLLLSRLITILVEGLMTFLLLLQARFERFLLQPLPLDLVDRDDVLRQTVLSIH